MSRRDCQSLGPGERVLPALPTRRGNPNDMVRNVGSTNGWKTCAIARCTTWSSTFRIVIVRVPRPGPFEILDRSAAGSRPVRPFADGLAEAPGHLQARGRAQVARPDPVRPRGVATLVDDMVERDFEVATVGREFEEAGREFRLLGSGSTVQPWRTHARDGRAGSPCPCPCGSWRAPGGQRAPGGRFEPLPGRGGFRTSFVTPS